VHGSVPVDELLKPDEGLRSMLLSLPQRDRLWVFTNADHRHAEACLRALGVRDLFQGVFHYESLQEEAARRNAGRILCKPQVDAFHAVLDLAGAAPHRTLFLDDSARNVQGASQAGLRAVQVGAPVPCAGALAAVVDIRHLTVVRCAARAGERLRGLTRVRAGRSCRSCGPWRRRRQRRRRRRRKGAP